MKMNGELSDQGNNASDALHDYGRRFSSALAAGAYAPHLSELQQRLQSKLRNAGKNIQNRMCKTNGHSPSTAAVAGLTAGGVALLALGAGVAYLFDPDRGRAQPALT